MPGRVFIVDDDDGFRRTLARVLRRAGYDVGSCESAEQARKQFPQEQADVVVLDYQLPDANGLSLLEELHPNAAGAAFLMVSAYPELDVAVEAMRRGAFDYVAKDAELSECTIRIERAAEMAMLRRRMAEATSASEMGPDAPSLVGQSAVMQRLRKRLEALAGSDDTTVLIIGETGTGKGVVARWIHAKSGRAYEPLVAVDCTTIPETLVESELFGHEKGAFSGAVGSKMGRVEAAGRGTLFLDEIGELDLPVQVKLLRLLEEREYTRVGSTRTRPLAARVIAATNRDLERAQAEGRFRADLRYRLEVFVVETPALRDRGEDIFILAAHFIAERARALGRKEPRLAPQVIHAMERYPFPGNVRELRNMVEQALLLSKGDILTLSDFPVLSRSRPSRLSEQPAERDRSREPRELRHDYRARDAQVRGAPVNPHPERAITDVGQPQTLDEIRERAENAERTRVVDALESCGGNVSAAARSLSLSRYQLLRRLRKFGLR